MNREERVAGWIRLNRPFAALAAAFLLLTASSGEAGVLKCAEDLDGNGVVDAFDLGQFLGAWGPNPGSPADFNGDGVVDAFDLAQLLGAWGPCPECLEDLDCEDGDPCTQNECLGGVCIDTILSPCCGDGVVEPPEVCDPPDGTTCDEQCQPLGPCPGEGGCCAPNGTPACDDVDCCSAVCEADRFCCEVEWDSLCSDSAGALCPKLCAGGPSDCCIAHGTPGCDDQECEDLICFIDPFCCDVSWDQACADFANGPGGCAVCQP